MDEATFTPYQRVRALESITGSHTFAFRDNRSQKNIFVFFDANRIDDETLSIYDHYMNFTMRAKSSHQPTVFPHPFSMTETYAVRDQLKGLAEKMNIVEIDPYALSLDKNSKETMKFSVYEILKRLQKEGSIDDLTVPATKEASDEAKRLLAKSEISPLQAAALYALLPVGFYFYHMHLDPLVDQIIAAIFVGYPGWVYVQSILNKAKDREHAQMKLMTNHIDQNLNSTKPVLLIVPEYMQPELYKAFRGNEDFTEVGLWALPH